MTDPKKTTADEGETIDLDTLEDLLGVYDDDVLVEFLPDGTIRLVETPTLTKKPTTLKSDLGGEYGRAA